MAVSNRSDGERLILKRFAPSSDMAVHHRDRPQ
jgi:hypothetical protein